MLLNKARAIQFLQQCGIDGVIATSPRHVTYLTDYSYWLDGLMRRYMSRPGASSDLALENYALLAADGYGALVVPPQQLPEAEDSWVDEVHVFGDHGLDESLIPAELSDRPRLWLNRMRGERAASAVDALIGVLRERKLDRSRLGLEFEGLAPGARAALSAALPQATFLDCSNLLRLVRAVKSPEEIARLTRAAEISEQAAQESLGLAAPGRTLTELVSAYRVGLAQRGADVDHFIFCIFGLGIASEPNYRLTAGDVLLVDYGCRFRHYFSDTGLTLALGELPPPLRDRYGALYEAVQAGAAQLRPGVLASTVRATMRASLARHGITTSYAHGHGFGLEVRDYPIIVEDTGLRLKDECIDVPSDLPLEVDMIINLEAPLYLAGVASLHLEQTFRVTPAGVQALVSQDRRQAFNPTAALT